MHCFETGETHPLLGCIRVVQNHSPELFKNMQHYLGKINACKERYVTRHRFPIVLTKINGNKEHDININDGIKPFFI